MSNTKVLLYEGIPITFGIGEKLWINATDIAKNAGKRTADWLNSPSTKEYIKCYCDTTGIVSTDLVRVIKGGDPSLQGTWIMEDLIVNYGQWISPRFAIWVSAAIKKLITEGTVSITLPKDYPSALRALADAEEARMIAEASAKENQEKAEIVNLIVEKANNYTMQQAANVLGTGRTRFFKWLRENGYFQENNEPYQKYIGQHAYFTVKEIPKDGKIYHTPFVTPLGLTHFAKKIEKLEGIRNKSSKTLVLFNPN